MKKRFILVGAVYSAVVSAVTGWIYITPSMQVDGNFYHTVLCYIARICFVLRNVVCGFFFMSAIALKDAADYYHQNPLLVSAYALAMIIAPICTVSAIWYYLRKAYYMLKNGVLGIGDDCIAVFGTADYIGQFVSHEDFTNHTLKVRAVVDQLGNHEEVEFLKKSVQPFPVDAVKCTDLEFDLLMKEMYIKKCKEIYIMYPSSADNLALYLRINTYLGKSSAKDVKIYCRCEDASFKALYHNYYDTNCSTCIAPKIFNLKDMKADALLSVRKLELKDIQSRKHILIVGFGRSGQRVLQRLINQMVVSPDNPIQIDVVDCDIDKQIDLFLQRWDANCLSVENRVAKINKNHADGELTISFYGMRTEGKQFLDLLSGNKEGYLYAAVCIEDTTTCVQCIEQFSNYVKHSHLEPFPVAASIDCRPELLMMMKNDKDIYSDIYFTGMGHYYTREMVKKSALEEAAKKFHWFYQKLSPVSAKDRPQAASVESPSYKEFIDNESWDHCPIYQQEASRVIAEHQEMIHQIVERELKDQKENLFNEWFGENGFILQLKDGIYSYDVDVKELVRKINSVPFLKFIGAMEHRRWSYMTIFSGWYYANQKRKDLKETPYLLGWEQLCEQYPETVIYDLMPLLYEMQMKEGK